MALTRSQIIALRLSPHSALKLPESTWRLIKELCLASRKTRRGCRGGSSARRARAARRSLAIGLANVRSVGKNADAISDFMVTYNVDVLALTETWLNTLDGDQLILSACPPGYAAVQIPRTGARGGGVAILHRTSIRVTRVSLGEFYPSSFEYLGALLQINSVSISLYVIYRPPKCNNLATFWRELSSFLELCSVSNTRLLLMGDFNFHVDVPSNVAAQTFLSMVNSFGLQHVGGSTHRLGHTLDLVLSIAECGLVRESCIGERIGESDHNSIITSVRVHKPTLPVKTITFRPFKSLDLRAFSNDLSDTPFVCQPSHDLGEIVGQLSSSITSVLDTYVPWRRKTFVIRPRNPWFSDDIAARRRLCRRAERLWRKRRLAVDAETLRMHQSDLAVDIYQSKSAYYRKKIDERARVIEKGFLGL